MLKRSDTFVKKSHITRDSKRSDGKRRSKKERHHQFDYEDTDIDVTDVEHSTVDYNGGLVPLKFYKEMEEKYSHSLKENNCLIQSLRKDIQSVEIENAAYKEKLLDLKKKFESATDEIKSAEISHQILSKNYKILQEQYEALKLREKSANDRATELSDKILDLEDLLNKQDFSQKPVEEKKMRVDELENKIQSSNDHISHSDTSEIFIYQKKLFEKNEIIKDLESKLQEAISEIEESSRTLMMLKTERSQADYDMMLMSSSQSKISHPKNQEQYFRKQLESLNHKLSVAAEKIRRYEQNEFGLPEAVVEIEKLKKQINIRDKNIVQLVSKINNYSTNPENLINQGENCLPGVTQSKRKRKKRRNIIFLNNKFGSIYHRKQLPKIFLKEQLLNKIFKWGKLKKKIHQFSMKYQNDSNEKMLTKGISEEKTGVIKTNMNLLHLESEVAQQIACQELPIDQRPIELEQEVEHSGDSGIAKLRMEELVAENDYLRKGMHEILESIRIQDGSSDVKVESKSLEYLLNALDQRHVTGWYHPAMRLEAELKCIDGVNAALREQIHSIRLEEKKAKRDLLAAVSKLNLLENDITNRYSIRLPKYIERSFLVIMDAAKSFQQLMNCSQDDNAKEDDQTKLREKFQRLYDRIIVFHGNLKQFCQSHEDEMNCWRLDKNKLMKTYSVQNLKTESVASVSGEIIMVSKGTQIESDENIEMVKNIECLKNSIYNLKSERETLMNDVHELKIAVIKHEQTITQQNKLEIQKIATLRKQLANSVPRSHLEETTKQLNDIILKYQSNLKEDLSNPKIKELILMLKDKLKFCQDITTVQKEYERKQGNENAETGNVSEQNKSNWLMMEMEDVNLAMEKFSHNEEIEGRQNIIKDLIEQLAEAEFELNEKNIELKKNQELVNICSNCQLEKKSGLDVCSGSDNNTFLSKESLLKEFGSLYKVSMNALNTMLNQKDEILSRYKNLISETREAHAKSLMDANVKETFIYPEKNSRNVDISIGELKTCGFQVEKLPQTSTVTEKIQYGNKLEEMENEIILLQRKCDYLTVQLKVWESEAQQQKCISDKKQLQIEELLNRFEIQHQTWFNTNSGNGNSNYVLTEVLAEVKDLVIDSIKKDQFPSEKEIAANVRFPKKSYTDAGVNTELSSFSKDNDVGTITDVKKVKENQHIFVISNTDAEDIRRELESISNLIENAESDEKTQKVISEFKINKSLRLKGGPKKKNIKINPTEEVEAQKKHLKDIEEQLQNSKLKLETVKKDTELCIKREVELVRWRENKKWQQIVEKLQEKLKADSISYDGLKKQNQSLKDAVLRLQREKFTLEGKARSALANEALEKTLMNGSEKRIEVLQKRINTLERTICDLQALNISQKNKLDSYESEINSTHLDRDDIKINKKNLREDCNHLGKTDVLLEIKKLKEDRETLLIDKAKSYDKVKELEEEIINLKEKSLVQEKMILVLQGKEETSSTIHNEVNALRVELARKAKLLDDVKQVLIRVRKKTELKKALTNSSV